MTESPADAAYLNPVYPRSFPDPFVLKFCGQYWAFCTGFWHDGRVFGVLRSRDLIHWQELGGAMAPFPEHYSCYWAPEVTYLNGKFYMYYSVGNEERMQIRVSVADQPAGPYVDSGHELTTEEFAIDAHVFVDTDEARYLFYATDFLTHTHVGTGTVCDRMIDPFTLAKTPRPVTRALYDWQVYDAQRAEKGGVRWHTVEGPSVLKHKGHYYQMFSGGNWKNPSYGVSYAIADNLENVHEWRQVADGERVLPILRTLPGKVIGPGHNSVVRGPDNRELFCVYHLWNADGSDRVMAIDRLGWAGERMLVVGPSTVPQLAPHEPSFADYFEREGGLGPRWEVASDDSHQRWFVRSGELCVEGRTPSASEARCQFTGSSFLMEVSARAAAPGDRAGGYGLSLAGGAEESPLWRALILPRESQIAVTSINVSGDQVTERITLPEDFDAASFHLLRLEVDGNCVSFRLDDWAAPWQGFLSAGVTGVALCAENITAAAFSGFALTAGWEDLFTAVDNNQWRRDWQVAEGVWFVRDQQLFCDAKHQSHALIAKAAPFDSYEMVVSARLVGENNVDNCFGFYPAINLDDNGPLVTVERAGGGWILKISEQETPPMPYRFPENFDAGAFQQFRFRKQGKELSVGWETEMIGRASCPDGPARSIGLYSRGAQAAFDAVRITHLVKQSHLKDLAPRL